MYGVVLECAYGKEFNSVISLNFHGSSEYSELPTMVFTTGISLTVDLPLAVKFVKGSIKQRFFRSINNPKCYRKSAPIIGFETSATIKGHCKVRLNLKSSASNLVPNVAILVPFAAYKTK
ncbi:hypothetical protein AVEN_109692-1 [Araneus ventricosus]|uniref:Uncharacterized protein n=1 Tax=Araneus ventricosus TaxID=182803 RepID=A0A4Y2MCE2_ARAVE|nr:hypothetical protein AVEN_109692-1 [Araneus ventricosus]